MPLCMRSFSGPILTSSVLCFVLSYASGEIMLDFLALRSLPKNSAEFFRLIFGQNFAVGKYDMHIYIYIMRMANPYLNLVACTFSNLPWFRGLTRITGFAERRG